MTPNIPQQPQGPPQGAPPPGGAPPPQLPQLQPQPPVPPSAWEPKGPQVVKAFAPQLKLPKNEVSRLAIKVQQDFFNAVSDHDRRISRWQEYYTRWRNRTELPALGEEDKSNYRVPLTQWHVFTKWAKELASLFGDDSEVTAKPVGADDQRRVRKIARFMTWRLFDSMKISNAAAVFLFRKILFGRSVAYAPWIRETFLVPMDDGSEQEMVHYDGPGFEPLWPDDFVVPAEDVRSLQDFSFVLRKHRQTPEQLLAGEEEGRYQGIEDNWELITNFSSDRQQRDWYNDQIKREKDLAEGVTYEQSLSASQSLIVYDWYGKWRRLKGKQDGSETNWDRRGKHESDLLIRYIPALNLVVGAQDLAFMYPTAKNRRPFVEAALTYDGSYWGMGFGELLYTMEQELTNTFNLSTQAMQFSVGPVIFYRPGMGIEPETTQYEPCSMIATEDPGSVKVVTFAADLEPAIQKAQEVISFSERVTGQTDQNMGRAVDRPNAPRTARQTMALLEEGDVRASLDMNTLRESWGEILEHFWALERMYGSPKTFFRVTEEDAGGLFPTSQGGAWLSEPDRDGKYDFDLKLATSTYSKEANKQNQLALYQIDLQNPLVVNNPRALWFVLDKIHKAFGDDRFADMIPEPPDIGLPVNPREEWTRCLEGEEIFVNPMDNDQLHMADHNRRLQEASEDPNYNPRAYNEMALHVQEHIRQMQQKKLMAELVSRLASSLNQPGGLVHGTPSSSLANVHQAVGDMIGANGPQKPGGKPK